MIRLAVFISNAGSGSNLAAIIDSIKKKKLNASIEVVVSSDKDAYGLVRARNNGIKTLVIPKKDDLEIALQKFKIDYICLAGWKLIIPDILIDTYKILNLHPGLIPDRVDEFVENPDGTRGLWNRGKLTDVAIKNFLDNNATYAGSSIHFLTHEFDFGKVLGRCFEKILKEDSVESLYKRLKRQENKLYVEVLKDLSKQMAGKKVLIIDSGGRGAVLAHKYSESKKVSHVFVVPGNPLMQLNSEKPVSIFPDLKTTSISQIIEICKKEKIDLVDVAQDSAVEAGLVDELIREGINAIGPTKLAGQIEWDKGWAKEFMKAYDISTAEFRIFNLLKSAKDFIKENPDKKFFVKAAGLAEGKGALPVENKEQGLLAIEQMSTFGKAGEKFVIEDWLEGEEFSMFAISDGEKFQIVGCAQDHKRMYDGDLGPNTGGLGCSTPPLVVTEDIFRQAKEIISKTIKGLRQEKRPYKGILYLGGIVVSGKVYVIEFNARWGDPEAEVIVPGVKNDLFDLSMSVVKGKLQRVHTDGRSRVVVTGALRTDLESKKREIFGLEKILNLPNVRLYGTRVFKEKNRFFVSSGRLFHLVSEGEDVAGARKKVYEAMSQIFIEDNGLHFRTDIGWRDLQRIYRKSKNSEMHTIRVIEKNKNEDLNGTSAVKTARVYRIEGADLETVEFLAKKLFAESITQRYTVDEALFNNRSKRIEIAYKPGVMNPEVASIIKSAKDLNTPIIAADSSSEYYFFGGMTQDAAEKFVMEQKLFNPLIEYIVKEEPKTLLIEGEVGPTNTLAIREASDEELMELSKDKLFLNLAEMKVIQNYFIGINRDPTDCELETLAQTWSEHCAHKTFKAKLIVDGKEKHPLIERIKNEARKHPKNIVSAFGDNSGVMEFYDGFSICGKVETHNSPSAIEPYGGAATGSGGVFRDILGTGLAAKTIASTDMFCFANIDLPFSDLPPGCLPPEYLLKRVVYGVRDYGNRMGIPTNNGSFHFHNDFRAKPTVIVGAYGIIPTKKAQKGEPKNGDLVIAVGSRTGRDGVHGATFSSGEMTDKTISVNSSAVQIGNAIEEKRMFDAIIEARDNNLIEAITDCGAGGFSSAVGEIGAKTGVKVDLSLVPLKYNGLSPWEIWVSESQERMVLAVSKKNLSKLLKICKKYNVEATVLGKFTNTKKLEVFYGEKLIADLSMEFLHHGLPQRTMIGKSPKEEGEILNEVQDGIRIPKTEKDWIMIFKKILSHGNVNSKEPIVRLYDHSVQGTNDLQPYSGVKLDGPNDAVVLRPILNKKYGMVLSHGLNPVLNKIDPYAGSIWAGVEALSNYISVGGNIEEASLINNYIWPFPDEESLWSLDRSVDAVCDLMKAIKIPVISGKDSLSSTYRKGDLIIKIPPVLCISVFGRIADATKTVSSDFKKTDSVICLVGDLDIGSMGGSVYFDVNGLLGNQVPKIDLNQFKKIAKTINEGISTGEILSCHDISEGGMLAAIFDMCTGGDLGASLKLHTKNRIDYLLFNETAGTFIVEVENEKIAKKLFGKLPFEILGKTQKDKKINIRNGEKIFSADLDELKKAWKEPMQKLFS